MNVTDYTATYDDPAIYSWFKHLQLTIFGAQRIAYTVHVDKVSVMVHCSDGWDRTAQLSALSQLLLDPFYRTIKGFCHLIEKEWISFGHMFAHRIGHGSAHHEDSERAPIFLQFLDCVYQLHKKATCDFEFNEQLLTVIMDECYACKFGTFLYNSPRERQLAGVTETTSSLWSYILNNKDKFYNTLYKCNAGPILLDYNFTYRNMRLWSYLYRWNRKLLNDAAIEYSISLLLISQIEEYKELLRAAESKIILRLDTEREKKQSVRIKSGALDRMQEEAPADTSDSDMEMQSSFGPDNDYMPPIIANAVTGKLSTDSTPASELPANLNVGALLPPPPPPEFRADSIDDNIPLPPPPPSNEDIEMEDNTAAFLQTINILRNASPVNGFVSKPLPTPPINSLPPPLLPDTVRSNYPVSVNLSAAHASQRRPPPLPAPKGARQ